MAGLQYNFFPTDFLYPRPPLADAAPKSVVPVQNRLRDVSDDVVLDEHQQQRQQQNSNGSARRNDGAAVAAALRADEKDRAPSPVVIRRNQRGSANSLSSLFPDHSSD